MNIYSAKAKGRRACAEVVELLYQYAPDLAQGDIRVTPSSVPGEDILLSPAAQVIYPLCCEVKNQEALNIWAALHQAEAHAGMGGRFPTVFFKRNHSKLYVALGAEHFMKLVR